jgi:hypothetical protein
LAAGYEDRHHDKKSGFAACCAGDCAVKPCSPRQL